MKLKYLTSWLVLILACSQNNTNKVSFSTPTTPKIFTLKSSANITIINDTAFFNNEKYSGYLYLLQPNGIDTSLIEAYQKGLKTGVSKKWYANKKLMEKRSYLNGAKNGKQLAYWDNGNKKFEFNAKNDAYQGELKEWNVNGKLIHLANYEDGQESGAQKMWYDNGKMRANYVIVAGKRYGLLGTKNCINVSDSVFSIR